MEIYYLENQIDALILPDNSNPILQVATYDQDQAALYQGVQNYIFVRKGPHFNQTINLPLVPSSSFTIVLADNFSYISCNKTFQISKQNEISNLQIDHFTTGITKHNQTLLCTTKGDIFFISDQIIKPKHVIYTKQQFTGIDFTKIQINSQNQQLNRYICVIAADSGVKILQGVGQTIADVIINSCPQNSQKPIDLDLTVEIPNIISINSQNSVQLDQYGWIWTFCMEKQEKIELNLYDESDFDSWDIVSTEIIQNPISFTNDTTLAKRFSTQIAKCTFEKDFQEFQNEIQLNSAISNKDFVVSEYINKNIQKFEIFEGFKFKNSNFMTVVGRNKLLQMSQQQLIFTNFIDQKITFYTQKSPNLIACWENNFLISCPDAVFQLNFDENQEKFNQFLTVKNYPKALHFNHVEENYPQILIEFADFQRDKNELESATELYLQARISEKLFLQKMFNSGLTKENCCSGIIFFSQQKIGSGKLAFLLSLYIFGMKNQTVSEIETKKFISKYKAMFQESHVRILEMELSLIDFYYETRENDLVKLDFYIEKWFDEKTEVVKNQILDILANLNYTVNVDCLLQKVEVLLQISPICIELIGDFLLGQNDPKLETQYMLSILGDKVQSLTKLWQTQESQVRKVETVEKENKLLDFNQIQKELDEVKIKVSSTQNNDLMGEVGLRRRFVKITNNICSVCQGKIEGQFYTFMCGHIYHTTCGGIKSCKKCCIQDFGVE